MNDEQVNIVVSKLSKNLQEELLFELRGHILKKFKIFKNNFSESFIKRIA